jgi:CheY-like chemotaxis protein
MQEIEVLLVDDDRYELQFLTRCLRLAHLVVEPAESGAEALKMLERYRPEVVVAALSMSEMSGARLCLALRGRGLEELPVLLHSASGDASARLLGLEAGAADVVTRTAGCDELILKIRREIAASRNLRFLRERAESRQPFGILAGTFGDHSAPALLQSIGLLELPVICVRMQSATHELGEIWLARGRVLHARAADLLGKRALRRILEWESGFFRVTREACPETATISESVEECLLGTLVYIDRYRAEADGESPRAASLPT